MEKNLRFILFLTASFGTPFTSQASHVLFYYNSQDINGVVSQCVTVLRRAGNRVTVIDVRGKLHDPTTDNWESPYDQIWDMRFVDEDKEKCGSGSVRSPDSFNDRWREKAIGYLNHCGKLFLGGEHYQLADRNEGLYLFLKEIQAVKAGYDSCPPSAQGNSTTNDEDFYPVKNALGPVSFFGAYVGGIPLTCLNGTNFVDTREDWNDEDHVDRSIASGWQGSQLGGRVNATPNRRGKLFMVWDATMWTYWQPEIQNEAREIAPWDESSWLTPNPDTNEERERAREIQRAQMVTRKFFPAIAKWLGNTSCPCGETMPATALAVNRETLPRVHESKPVFQPSLTPVTSSFVPKSQISISKVPGLSGPETIKFDSVPINLYINFRDGAGAYQLDIWNFQNQHLRTIFYAQITTQKEAWASWDGTNEKGLLMPASLYYGILSKEGRVLRKVVLSWATLK